LQERDFGVKVQKRKPWKRPQSDYGNRLGRREKSDKSGEGGEANGGAEDLGLNTLLGEDGSVKGGQGTGMSSDLVILGEGGDAGKGRGDGKTGSSRGSSTESSRRK